MLLARLVSGRGLATLALAGALVGTLAAPLQAATYRNHIARVPNLPNALQSTRIWMESDTAFGETACIEYHVGATFVKVLGVFDLTGPAPANWRADIPAQLPGRTVSYQLFTRNQSGTDYGFTGFNWQYTVDAPVATQKTTFGRLKALYR